MATTNPSKRVLVDPLLPPEARDARRRPPRTSNLKAGISKTAQSVEDKNASRTVQEKRQQQLQAEKKKALVVANTNLSPAKTSASKQSKNAKTIAQAKVSNNKRQVKPKKNDQSKHGADQDTSKKDGAVGAVRRGNMALSSKTSMSKTERGTKSVNKGALPIPPAVRTLRDKPSAKMLSPAAAVAAAAKDRAARTARAKPQPKGRFDSMQPGRQFTVGNIGANGLITLRPMVRAAQDIQRQRQPLYPFSDVIPPPEKEPPPAPTRRRNSSFGAESVFSSAFSQSQHRRPSLAPATSSGAQSRKASGHFRSHSFSTLDDRSSRATLSRQGTSRSIVRPTSRRTLSRRASVDTSNDFIPEVPALPQWSSLANSSENASKAPSAIPSSDFGPLADVKFPSFKLAKPHFGSRGSALLRVSRSTDPRTSQSKSRDGASFNPASSRIPSTLASEIADGLPLDLAAESDDVLVPRAPVLSTSSPRGSISQFAMTIFAELAENPDDMAFVRYNAMDEIIAATPSRLIAHITSPSFLDYELLSDFFLTFRVFLLPDDLVSYLVARLRWAVERVDDFGRIVRVRTFVALRHWILNYYSDDFAPDFALRVHFCDLVNGLYQDLQRRADGGGGDLKIIGELKKCWRRTCGVYWPAEKGVTAMDEDIFPGGRYDSIYWEGEDAEVGHAMPIERVGGQVKEIQAPEAESGRSFGHRHQHSKAQSSHRSIRFHQPPLSPTSIQSLHVVSCSIPFKPLFRHDDEKARSLFPHPVLRPLTPLSNVSVPGKGSKRGEPSLETSRGHISTTSKSEQIKLDNDAENDSAAPGSLVHGALYPPNSPYFEFKTTIVAKGPDLAFNMPKFKFDSDLSIAEKKDGAEGMKKLLGNMRRAFANNRGLMSPMGVPHSPAMYSTDQDVSQSTVKFSNSDLRTMRPVSTAQIRIDILTSTAAEAFRLAVEIEQSGGLDKTSTSPGQTKADTRNRSSSYREHGTRVYPGDRSVTVGSRSIVIMDDTNAEAPLMSGALSPPEEYRPHTSYELPAGARPSRENSSHQPLPESQAKRSSKDRHQTSLAPAVYVPGMVRTTGNPAVYMPTGYQKVESATQPERLYRGSRGNFSNSLHSNSPSSSIRKYASYHSGVTNSVAYGLSPRRGSLQESLHQKIAGHDVEASPSRTLRRRAGGNLKNVDDDSLKSARRHSVGSVSTRPRSRHGSFMYRSSQAGSYRLPLSPVHGHDEGSTDDQRSQLSAAVRKTRGRSISLIQTHSSQPNLRPSFEAEVAKLKALPDDDDDGGIESTLLKLEGRYEKKSPVTTSDPNLSSDQMESSAAEAERHRKHHEHVEDIQPEHPLPIGDDEDYSIDNDEDVKAQTRSIFRHSDSPAMSRVTSHRHSRKASANTPSMPALDHLLRDDESKSQRRQESRNSQKGRKIVAQTVPGTVSIASSRRAPTSEVGSRRVDSAAAPPNYEDEEEEAKDMTPSLDNVMARQKSMASSKRRAAKKNSAASRKTAKSKKSKQHSVDAATSSFLFDGGSDDSEEEENDDYEAESFYDDNAADDEEDLDELSEVSEAEDTKHEDEESSLFGRSSKYSDTPPKLLVPALKAIERHTPQRAVKSDEVALSTSPIIPTSQGPSPGNKVASKMTINVPSRAIFDEKDTSDSSLNSIMHPPHLAFILAYEPDHLAQQFTILEKDALEELDWRELIDMKWNQSPTAATDWVAYLRTPEPFGVGLVIARFNLMVKWVISELMITDSPQERARTIVHYIRVAAHCRVLRNFATMYQITVALLSADCARLKRTWSFVPDAEISVLQDLERLVQPIRNFHNLRVEMETAPTDAGCIPFIGIYTRDLVYNAQKPAVITSEPQNPFEPLVNFERHSTAAGIVKSLLRLLEQSTKYDFTPDPQCLARCLWVAALDESEIRLRGDILD